MGIVSRSRTVVGAVCLSLMFGVAASAAAEPSRSPVQSKGSAAAPAPVDLNAASVEQLIEIPGIGQATAERIVVWRNENGPFQRVEDLMKVKGIGEKSFEKLRPYVTVKPGR